MLLIFGECQKNSNAALNLYRTRYPERRIPNRKYFARLENKFRREPDTEDADDNVEHENEILVLAYIEYDRTASIREIERSCNVPKETARKILKSHKFKSYKYNLHQHLYPNDHDRRLLFCNWVTQNNQVSILFSDESRFTNNGMFNRNNTRYWSQRNLHLLREGRFQEQFGINVWMGVLENHLLGPIFFNGTLTGERYLQFLRNEIEDLLENLPVELYANLYFQQDGAPPHNTRIVTTYLDDRFPNRWIGTNGPIRWPARSPDLTPLDFFLWPFVKEKVLSAVAPRNLEDLQAKIRESILLITPHMLQNVRQGFLHRVQNCINAQGGHFEQLL